MIAIDEEMSPRRKRRERVTAREQGKRAGTEFAHGIDYLKTNKDYNAEEVYAQVHDGNGWRVHIAAGSLRTRCLLCARTHAALHLRGAMFAIVYRGTCVDDVAHACR